MQLTIYICGVVKGHMEDKHIFLQGRKAATLAVCKKAKWKREMNDVGMYHIQKPITFRIAN
jgi:hypothetical protein